MFGQRKKIAELERVVFEIKKRISDVESGLNVSTEKMKPIRALGLSGLINYNPSKKMPVSRVVEDLLEHSGLEYKTTPEKTELVKKAKRATK